MGDQASFYHNSAFYLWHFGFLSCLFLMAVFRSNLAPLFSISMASQRQWQALAQKSSAPLAFLVALLIQWWVYDNLDWLEFWYWPLIAFAAACLWKRRSFWFVFGFYLLHYNFAFDGPRAGSTCTVVKSPEATLAFVQERYVDELFGTHPSGLDQIFGGYRGWGLIDWEAERFSFGLIGKYLPYYRPRVTSRFPSGELVIRFGSKHYVTVYPDRTYVEYREGQSQRSALGRWGAKEDFGDVETLRSEIAKAYTVQQIESQNYVYSFFLYVVYPVFFTIYWCRPEWKKHFTDSGWFYLVQGILMFFSYLPLGIPEPVFWPMLLMFLGWLKKQNAEAFFYLVSTLIAIWATALLVNRVSLVPVSWIGVCLIWMVFAIFCLGTRFGRPRSAEVLGSGSNLVSR